ncbi:MAG: hypothetical protein H7A50_17125 [Akkermansiaceae bacterium]|nr:hypothetical protein [Akkermansiaceae bacterium]
MDPAPAPSRDELIRLAGAWLDEAGKSGFDSAAGITGRLADWTTGEILAALDASLENPDCVLGPHAWAVDLLFGELMKRDIELAVRWFDDIPIDVMRGRMASGASYRWPAEHAERGLGFVLSHKDLYPHGAAWSILVKNMEARAVQGPESLGELLQTFAEENLDLDFGNPTKLPEDFDFQAFVGTEGFLLQKDKSAVKSMLNGWLASDREAAFAWCVANNDIESLIGMLPMDYADGRADVEWLGEKLSTLDDEQAARLFGGVSARLNRDPRSAAAFANGARDPGLRERALEICARCVLRGDVEFALTQLEGIPDAGRRVEILVSMVPIPSELQSFGRSPVTAEKQELLRGTLADWGADERQIETVLKNVKP